MATTGSVYNHSRQTRQLLKRNRKNPASFYLHLHPTWFRFEDAKGRLLLEEPISEGMAVAGPSRLASSTAKANTPGKELLRCIRDQQLPNFMLDILDLRRIPFFDGCLIVEIKDHRQPEAPPPPALPPPSRPATKPLPEEQKAKIGLEARLEGGRYGTNASASLAGKKANTAIAEQAEQSVSQPAVAQGPETYRVVLHPNEETLWTEMRALNEKLSGGTWAEEEALAIESKVLTLTSAPLCLDPDPHATWIANLMLAATAPVSRYAPVHPLPHQRNLPPIADEREVASTSEPAETAESEEQAALASAQAQQELVEKQRRDALMRLMEGGWRMHAKDKRNTGRTGQARLPNTSPAVVAPFVPTFHRLAFIERYRAQTNKGAAKATGQEASDKEPAGSDTGSGKKDDGGKGSQAQANTNGTAKKAPSKKRKKAEMEAAAAEEREKEKEREKEEAAAPKSKKKKTSAAAKGATDAAPEKEAPAKGKGSKDKDKDGDKTAGSPDKKSKSKPKLKKAAANKKDAEADAAPTPAADAPTPSVNGDAENASGAGAKGGKKTPASKKPAAKATAAKKAPAGQNSRQKSQSNTPALHPAQLPQGSPNRQPGVGAPSPFNGVATPSPALSHQGIPHGVPGGPGANMAANNMPMGAGPFANLNLPLGMGLPMNTMHDASQQQQQQQAAAAVAASFGMMGMSPMQGMNGAGGNGANGPGPALNLPYGQPQAQYGGMNGGGMGTNGLNLPMGNKAMPSGADAGAGQGGQMRQQTGFAGLPLQFQQQIMGWQQQQQQHQQQQQQHQVQQGDAGGDVKNQLGAHQGGGGGMLPPGWPIGQ